jgi:TonB family protein
MRPFRSRHILIPSVAIFAIASSTCDADCTDISYAKLKPPVYPPQAVAAKAEGRILVQATVAVDGTPGNLVVRTGSGNADLDQAALDAVLTWRFNPRTCDGSAVVADVIVPVEFNLSQLEAPPEATGVMMDERPTEAGGSVASSADRELAPDRRAMDAANVAELLRHLRNGDGIVRADQRAVTPATTLAIYFQPEERALFEVLQSTDHGWTVAKGGGWTSIIRTRFVDAGRRTFELYGQLCDGDSDWCTAQLAAYIARMQDDPPLVPPPAPHDASASRRVSSER